MKSLILGIGNDIKRDDAVGLIAAREIHDRIEREDIEVKEASSGGLPLLDEIKGYDRVSIIDSVVTPKGEPGDWYPLPLEDLEGKSSRIASHSVDLKTMQEMGRKMGESMPEIKVYAVEVKNSFEFGESLTEEMKEEMPKVISGILKSIREEIPDRQT